MAADQGEGGTEQRFRLLGALMEVNSRHLSGEARRAGAEISLQRALEDEAGAASATQPAGEAATLPAAEHGRRVAALRRALETVEGELRALACERERLAGELAALDAAGDGR